MRTYYVGAKEIERTLGLFPKLKYFALFAQPLKLGENVEDWRAWYKEQRERGGNILARITAGSINNLAEGLTFHAGTAEKIHTIQDENGDSCALILEEDGAESYLKLDNIEKLKRSMGDVIAITPNGEHKCKTCVDDYIDGNTEFMVRHYSQIPIEELGYREGTIVEAFQQNRPGWEWSMDCRSSPTRDLNLREQWSLAQQIETILKRRTNRNRKWPVRLVDKCRINNRPEIYEVVKY